MARTAFLLGGGGMIGRAAGRRLLAAGWDVVVGSRGERPLPDELEGARHVRVDRRSDDLTAAVGDGVDALVDMVAFGQEDAEQLLGLSGRVGALVAISSASVYADDAGRTLDEASGPDDFPDFPVPIREDQRTVPPGPETYSTGKAALERVLLEQDEIPATVIRPCAIHGPGDRQAREWFFVKRALDGRPFVPIAFGGESLFHTTCSDNLGELIRLVCERPGTRALNCGDPDPPTVLEISRVLARVLDHDRAEILLPGPPADGVGATPWSTAKPLVVDMAEAEREVGYRPVVSYGQWVERTVEYLVAATREHDWTEAFPVGARYIRFDYEAEDELVRSLAPG